jgi:CheY-like chemotaxis protein/predicted DNA-binding protein (UPF0251 family)
MPEPITYSEFEEALYATLANLYDPEYRPPDGLCEVVGCNVRDGMAMVRGTLLRTIESLAPTEDTPAAAYPPQLYELLRCRFVLKFTQARTAEELNVSRRTVNRMQRRAVHLLAGVLWERKHAQTPPREDRHSSDDAFPGEQAEDWQGQMQRELASLENKAPGTVADVGEAIQSVLDFIAQLPSLEIRLRIASIQPDLVAAMHPVVLHQVLISIIKRLAAHTLAGALTIYARLEDGDARITLTGPVDPDHPIDEAGFTAEIPVPAGVSIETHLEQDHAFVWVTVPSVGKVSVLVVDDNEDMIRFYRDATIGTRYHMTSRMKGEGLLDLVTSNPPDIIVLDVMLPDIDGWRLLMRLHEDRQTRSIPVIICTVVRERELAMSLGAIQFLSKPIRPRAFIRALDQASRQAASASSKVPPTTAESE